MTTLRPWIWEIQIHHIHFTIFKIVGQGRSIHTHELFGNDNPIHIEVGSGKGAFITGMAQQNPDINYIGIDIQLSVLSYALDKVLASGAENVKLLRVDVRVLLGHTSNEGPFTRSYLDMDRIVITKKLMPLTFSSFRLKDNVLRMVS